MPNIKLKDKTKERLNKIIGKLMTETGKNYTYDDIVLELLNHYEKTLKKEKSK